MTKTSLNAFTRGFVISLANPHIANNEVTKINGKIYNSDELIYGYYTPADHPAVKKVRKAVVDAVGREPDLIRYKFATDGRHFVDLGVPIIGYSAGQDQYAHTVQERISIPMMLESLKGHLSIIMNY